MNGQTVKALRKAKQLSRAALAVKVGVAANHIWRIEKGLTVNPSHRTVVNLAAALGVEPEQLTKPSAV